MENVLKFILSPVFLGTILRVSTPLLFASLGALVAGQGGVMCIAFEGVMISAALGGVIGSSIFSSVILGVIVGVSFGLIIMALFAYFVLKLEANNILTGLALNILASGGTIFVLFLLTAQKGSSTSLASMQLPNIDIPIIHNIPYIGPILSGHNLMTYIALISTVFVYFLINKTILGLRIRTVGENPEAAKSVGINVNKIKAISLLISGVLASLGGVYMSMGYLPFFTKDMISGRGFMALAAQSLGGGKVFGTFVATIFFALTQSISNVLASLNLPSELLQMTPYLATLVGLVLVGKLSRRSKKQV